MALPSYRRKTLAKCAPWKLVSILTITYWKLKFGLWFDFCEVCFWEKSMPILLIHTFWFSCQLYSKQFFKKSDCDFTSHCLTLIGFLSQPLLEMLGKEKLRKKVLIREGGWPFWWAFSRKWQLQFSYFRTKKWRSSL